MSIYSTLQEENVRRYLNFAVSLMANSLNFNSAYCLTFRDFSTIAYILIA